MSRGRLNFTKLDTSEFVHSDWDVARVAVLRFLKTCDLAKQTYSAFCKFPNYESGSDNAMERGMRGKKKKSLTDTDTESPQSKIKKSLALPPVIVKPAGKAKTAASTNSVNKTPTQAVFTTTLKKTTTPPSSTTTLMKLTTQAVATLKKTISSASTTTLKTLKPAASTTNVNVIKTIVVQSRGDKRNKKVLEMVDKSKDTPQKSETIRLEQLEKKRLQILKDRDKKSALQEEKRKALLESIRTGHQIIGEGSKTKPNITSSSIKKGTHC
ncbi:uncharacterized protein LOC127749936 isoform X1 [Frankliniella occidentalis]|uniref:Uncharacterized protein LOC127749936 isoform X1 n=1 Tax=Frankliniella occidentalis TaxID=133901 RepID=A0A9C6U248_FRAOC|nr:uncharacterized protein LOC127749936 isoform X1 [Frankliniella occidentalis]